ncbi:MULTISPECIES: diaminobutyrate--2-oxoglutarate transaminase [Thiomicrorhabdus]|uniref:Diaminobutyrate--2-oxoglutarate transaminase n=1 Tax=Thiomicrorhabdus heinhorstiae TaxID=2748010 RepID=A0ABS0BY86_9GAMM|nr:MULTISPECIES: diaminobutyrate--2-oxoglutarate transaminase [Thiomicrorhabdus]MBF6058744.1 diaminobutyrate--2-oxoglutarate transaminase [Thiomicrorhabdus heinhorstiae]
MSLEIFNTYESEVRGYIRSFPTVFSTSKNAEIWDEDGKRYIDFFAGAGALNYGHNNQHINAAVIDYMQNNGIGHALDMGTVAKRDFIEAFVTKILQPRHLNYKLQFVGPTGTNAIETALKIARKVKGRKQVISFTNGFHGMSMGSLSITGNRYYHDDSYGVPGYTTQVPYNQYLGAKVDTIAYLRKILEDASSGTELPAAIVLETIQAEGGINVAEVQWLKELRKICDDFDTLMIVDDIQVGNGRTGDFFSFERAGIKPDIVTLSKSIGGGHPMSLVLMKPELDKWSPGEHSGTFRGNNLAFVASTTAINTYWSDDHFSNEIKTKSKLIQQRMEELALTFPSLTRDVRGHGFIWGIEFHDAELCSKICSESFDKGLVVETAGSEGNVIKFLGPLIISEALIEEGFDILKQAIETCSQQHYQ